VASQQAREAAQAERAVRERQEQVASQLRAAIYEYTTFLERVQSGDYSARLDLSGIDKDSTGELRTLGQHINATVESLVNAMNNLQAVQQRYARAAWEHYIESRAAQRGFRYSEETDVEVTEQAWLPPMAEAVSGKDLQATDRDLALPLTLRGEVIGALGVRRKERQDWTEDDVALAQAITDQLAQTIESLRLLDETQRNAAREQALSDLTARFARSLDMDTLLQVAVRELGQVLQVDEISVHVGNPSEDRPEGTSEQPDTLI
jgi:GAF domain-containing protein